MRSDDIYIGTDLKFLLKIEAEDFSMVEDDFHVKVVNSSTKKFIVINKEDMPVDEEDNYYLCFSTESLGKGFISVFVYASVPDEDFDTGIRREIYKLENVIRLEEA